MPINQPNAYIFSKKDRKERRIQFVRSATKLIFIVAAMLVAAPPTAAAKTKCFEIVTLQKNLVF